MKRKIILVVSLVVLVSLLAVTACKKKSTSTPSGDADTSEQMTTPESNNVTTQETTTEEPTTEAPTTQAPTEAPTTAYVGAYTLLNNEPLNPTRSGYAELDTLVDKVLAQVVTPDMNGYQKAWACYLYIVDNITYSRGFADNTGAYSTSDPATTPVEVLWATDLFNSGLGACYNYSSAYVYLMRAIGFDAHLVSGSVPKYGGGTTPHCWMYVNLGGQKYTFDPDLDMNYHARGENETKDMWFCRTIDSVSYFYQAETYHTN